MVKQGLTITLIALQVWQPVLAGVVSSNPKITQDQAANGVPVVNIATPGQSGISHNTYTRFDVDRQGLILNNSGQPVNTQLGGYIPGNANLHNGSARLILNEVSGNLPSQLKGYMEIAGQKAEMIIANPAGITCDGCGFINTSRGTFTTGKPLFGSDGNLSGFRVEDGTLAIDGLGLNASNTERLNLYSRALVLNAELHARDLNVVTGTNDINVVNGVVTPTASGSTAPNFSIDSSSLGGMYANRIRLVGTEAGVGMRLAAPVAAMNGNLEITSNGDVRLVRASATQRVDVRAEGNVAIDSDGAGDRDGISSGAGTTLRATGAVTLASGADITGAAIGLIADSVDTANDSDIAARSALAIDADNMQLVGTIASQQTITLTGNTIANQGQVAANTGITISASSLDNSGRISSAGGNGRLMVAGELRNDGGEILHGGMWLELTADMLDNRQGAIISNGQGIFNLTGIAHNMMGLLQANHSLTLSAAALDNTGGDIFSNGDIGLLLHEGALNNTGGWISTTGSVELNTPSALLNQNGRLLADQDISLHLPVFNQLVSGGDIQANGVLALYTQGSILLNDTMLSTPGSLVLNAGVHDIQIHGRVEAGDGVTLHADAVNIDSNGWLLADADLTISARQLANRGIIFGRDTLSLFVQETLDNSGTKFTDYTGEEIYQSAALISEGDIRIEGRSGARLAVLNNIGSQIESLGGNIHLKVGTLHNRNEGWSLSPEMREALQTVYSDACNKYCAGNDHIWNFMFDGEYSCCYVVGGSNRAPILYESRFYDEDNLIFENVWLYRTRSWLIHRDVSDIGRRSGVAASTSADGSGGNIFIEADLLENGRSSISAAAMLDIQAREIRNTATRLYDSYEHFQESRRKSCSSSNNCRPRDGTPIHSGGDYASRPDQIISAVLEGSEVNLHGTEVIWNADGEEGEVIRSQTSVTPQGPWGLLPRTGPEGLLLADQLPPTLLDPTALPGFHLPNGGLYQRKTTPGHPYLIETDPALNTYQGFLGSGYLLSHLAWSPEVTQRRLGDSYYELMLIRDVLLASIGSRFLDPRIADERQQFEYLMQNAIAAAETLHLSAGVSLSRAQIDALQQDIVWLEEKEVLGERVLVPVVYLAQGSSRLLGNGAVIGGGTVTISGEDVRNSGLVRARDGLAIQTGQSIQNRGGTLQSEGDLWLISEGDILNDSGRIRGHDVVLAAGGDITHRTWSARDIHDSSNSRSWSTRVGEQASVTATGQMLQQAGGNLQLTGARLDGTNVALAAGNNLIIDAVQLDQGYHLTDDGLEQAAAYTRHLTSQISALQHLQLQAGADLIAIAADIRAGESATLEAGGNLLLLAAEESDHYESHSEHDGSMGRSKSRDVVRHESNASGTTVQAGDVLSMNAGNSIVAVAASLKGGAVDLVAEAGEVSLLAAYNTLSEQEQSKGGGHLTKAESQSSLHSTTAVATAIDAGDGGVLIRSSGNQTHEGTRIRSGAGIELVSEEGKVILGAVKSILQSQYSSSGDNGLVMKVETGSEHHETVSMVQMESVVAPIVRAAEGISVSIREEAGASNEAIDALVKSLSQQKGMEWLADLDAKGQIDYSRIREIHESKHDTTRSMGLVASVIVAIAVTALTAGAGAAAGTAVATTVGASGLTATVVGAATMGVVSSAAVMSANATVNSALNGDGIEGVHDRLNNSDTAKGLLTGAVTAGVTAGLGEGFFGVRGIGSQNISTNPALMPAKAPFDLSTFSGVGKQLAYNLTMAGSGALVDVAINGGDWQDNLENSFRAGVANTVGAFGFEKGADLTLSAGMFEGSFGRALIHAGTGAITGEVLNSDAVGGAASAFVTAMATPGLVSLTGGNDKYTVALGEITGAVSAALVTGNAESATTGQSVARLEVQNNYLKHKEVEEMTKDLQKCRFDSQCIDSVRDRYRSISAAHEAEMKACKDDTCRLYHQAHIKAGMAALNSSTLTINPSVLKEFQYGQSADSAMNLHRLSPELAPVADLAGFAIANCNGQFTAACQQAYVRVQDGHAKQAAAIAAVVFAPGLSVMLGNGIASCVATPGCMATAMDQIGGALAGMPGGINGISLGASATAAAGRKVAGMVDDAAKAPLTAKQIQQIESLLKGNSPVSEAAVVKKAVVAKSANKAELPRAVVANSSRVGAVVPAAKADAPVGGATAVTQPAIASTNVSSDLTALLDDYHYQPEWTSYDDYFAQVDGALNEEWRPKVNELRYARGDEFVKNSIILEFDATTIDGPFSLLNGEERLVTYNQFVQHVNESGLNGVFLRQLSNVYADVYAVPKLLRPAPSTYLNTDFIAMHTELFTRGAARVDRTLDFNTRYKAEIEAGLSFGRPDAVFVSPASLVDDLYRTGDPAVIEGTLGFPAGTFSNAGSMTRTYIYRPQDIGLRLSTGAEDGANPYWLPGGYTFNIMGGAGVPEMVTNQLPSPLVNPNIKVLQ